jgi:hypothetical protein
MRNRLRRAMPLLVATVVCLVVLAIPASAAPECTTTGPRTTMCQNPGNAQIVTTPPHTSPVWPWGGGFVIGFGRW